MNIAANGLCDLLLTIARSLRAACPPVV